MSFAIKIKRELLVSYIVRSP